MNQATLRLTSWPLQVDLGARQVMLDGEQVHLTRTEFDILALLMGAPKQVFTRQQLVEQVWGAEWVHVDHSINVHLSNLRGKIRDRRHVAPWITTVRGVGYRFDAPVTRDRDGHYGTEWWFSASPTTSYLSPVADLAAEPAVQGSDPLAIITLTYDAAGELVAATPEQATADLTGRVAGLFTPESGVDQQLARFLLVKLQAAGVQQISGITTVHLRDGESIEVPSDTRLTTAEDGSYAGHVTQLVVPLGLLEGDQNDYAGGPEAVPAEESHRTSQR